MNDRSARNTAPLPAGALPEDLPVLRVRFADVRPEIHVAGNSEEPDDQVLVLPGGTNLPGSLWLDYRAGSLLVGDDKAPVVGIPVRGDLRIGGCLVNWEDDYGPFLQVHGDLTATGIATGGSQIHIGGNVITDEVVGVYSHGSVTIDGDLTARLIATEHTVSAMGHTTGLRYTGWATRSTRYGRTPSPPTTPTRPKACSHRDCSGRARSTCGWRDDGWRPAARSAGPPSPAHVRSPQAGRRETGPAGPRAEPLATEQGPDKPARGTVRLPQPARSI
jgi:hypothetical protein